MAHGGEDCEANLVLLTQAAERPNALEGDFALLGEAWVQQAQVSGSLVAYLNAFATYWAMATRSRDRAASHRAEEIMGVIASEVQRLFGVALLDAMAALEDRVDRAQFKKSVAVALRLIELIKGPENLNSFARDLFLRPFLAQVYAQTLLATEAADRAGDAGAARNSRRVLVIPILEALLRFFPNQPNIYQLQQALAEQQALLGGPDSSGPPGQR